MCQARPATWHGLIVIVRRRRSRPWTRPRRPMTIVRPRPGRSTGLMTAEPGRGLSGLSGGYDARGNDQDGTAPSPMTWRTGCSPPGWGGDHRLGPRGGCIARPGAWSPPSSTTGRTDRRIQRHDRAAPLCPRRHVGLAIGVSRRPPPTGGAFKAPPARQHENDVSSRETSDSRSAAP